MANPSAQTNGHSDRDATMNSDAELDRRDLDDFSEDELPHAPQSLTERRRAQKAI